MELDWRLLYAVRSDAGAMITCTCAILRYAITLEFQSLCEYLILSSPSISLVTYQLASASLHLQVLQMEFLTKKSLSDLVLYLITNMLVLPLMLTQDWMKI